ncbi:hypothetical protein PYCC9005_001711 [Savitreella phatthalungensis]
MQPVSAPWTGLPGHQNILVQVLFTEHDYKVRVSDLRSIWGEDVSQSTIKQRSQDLKSPIDAELDMHDLLAHLQDALTVRSATTDVKVTAHNERLTIETSERLEDDAIEETLSLNWKFELAKMPADTLAASTMLSAISYITFLQDTLAGVQDVVRLKDATIRQLLEHLDASGAPHIRSASHRALGFVKWDGEAFFKKRRERAEEESRGSTASDVLDALTQAGKDSNFRKNWKACTTGVASWRPNFLDRDVSGNVAQAEAEDDDVHEWSPPSLEHGASTQSQMDVFKSPTKRARTHVDDIIHTKWSSPVSSSQVHPPHQTLPSEVSLGRSPRKRAISPPGTPSKEVRSTGADSLLKIEHGDEDELENDSTDDEDLDAPPRRIPLHRSLDSRGDGPRPQTPPPPDSIVSDSPAHGNIPESPLATPSKRTRTEARGGLVHSIISPRKVKAEMAESLAGVREPLPTVSGSVGRDSMPEEEIDPEEAKRRAISNRRREAAKVLRQAPARKRRLL